jgi:hypothetical protein
MTRVATAIVPTHVPLSFRQRAGFAASLALASGTFLTVGWSALAPVNPLGAVALWDHPAAAKALAVAAVLSALLAAVSTVLAGRRLVDVGIFTACIGLALTSLCGGTSAVILIAAADGHDQGPPLGVPARFALESAAWLVAPLAAMFVSALLDRRLFTLPPEDDRVADDGDSEAAFSNAPGLQPAAFDLRLVATTNAATCTPWTTGAIHTLIASCVALVGVHLFSSGLANRSIQHGQACFVVIAATFAGTWAAGRIVPVRSALWAILAGPVLAIAGYLWSDAGASPLPDLPQSPLLRILPVQLISVGTATAIGTTWWLRGGDGPERDASGLVEVPA